jgi:hypothetical protein
MEFTKIARLFDAVFKQNGTKSDSRFRDNPSSRSAGFQALPGHRPLSPQEVGAGPRGRTDAF